MPRFSLRAFNYLLALSFLVVCVPVMAATPPTLFSVTSGNAEVLAQGAQKSWSIKLSEDGALDAVFQGGMWLPNPAGGRIYAKYARHIIHANGTWTWIGTVSTVRGEQSVVLTFGKDGAFGLIPQASGYPLRIVTRAGQTRVVETSAEGMTSSTRALRLHSQPDFMVPSPAKNLGRHNFPAPTSAADVAVQAPASGPVTIDVMVAYTAGFVSELGSANLALTRIQNLVDITNTAYVDSGVNQQIRLVHTVQVNYPDNSSNDSALTDITGLDSDGNPVLIPASLQGIAALRAQYGADLVDLIRSYDNATQGGCGEGWLIGSDGQPIVPSQSNNYGYSVTSDGSDGGYYCVDTTFAHELGHNMGDAHDRANADNPGAYPYSYGYRGNGTRGFSTIMAYGTESGTPLAVFSNPNIATCQNMPCGVPDSSPDSADNAHGMNNTAALIAQFEPTTVVTPPRLLKYVHNDVNGDGKSDLLWRSKDNSKFAYWIMDGAQLVSSLAIPSPQNYRVLAAGDFNGDGYIDIIWTDGAGMWMWIGNGSTFTTVRMQQHYPTTGWGVVDAADFDGDGDTDLLWAKQGQLAEWLMNGSTLVSSYTQAVPSGWRFLATGDFDGDAEADVLLTNGTAMQMWINFNNGQFTPVATHTYPPGWTILRSGDINGDGVADLLWRDNSRTRFTYWIMDGPQLVSSLAINVSPQWHFGTAGDFNGDGLLDLVWYNTAEIVLWPGTVAGAFQGVVVHSYPSAWTMLP